MNEGITWVDRLDGDTAHWAGPKMATLGALHQQGVRVPDGFVLSAAAFLRVLDQREVGEWIDQRLAAVPADDLSALEVVAAQIADRLADAPWCARDRDDITAAYALLCERAGRPDLRVAVRSSATREDGEAASFAGQYTTILGCFGIDDVLSAVRSCWASFFSAHALQYRLRQGISTRASPMAVGIIELVHAHASGVAFSAHPRTGQRDRCVIEGSFGWGEAIVQGLVTPDHVELEHRSGRVLDYRVADKRVRSQWDADARRVVEGPMPDGMRHERVLDESMLASLHGVLRRIEAGVGRPVDVEWVLEPASKGGALPRVTVVQARPITALPDAPAAKPRWDPAGYAARYGLSGVR